MRAQSVSTHAQPVSVCIQRIMYALQDRPERDKIKRAIRERHVAQAAVADGKTEHIGGVLETSTPSIVQPKSPASDKGIPLSGNRCRALYLAVARLPSPAVRLASYVFAPVTRLETGSTSENPGDNKR